jgi:hypothetical protein
VEVLRAQATIVLVEGEVGVVVVVEELAAERGQKDGDGDGGDQRGREESPEGRECRRIVRDAAILTAPGECVYRPERSRLSKRARCGQSGGATRSAVSRSVRAPAVSPF